MQASGTCCLVQSGGHRIIFDTMGPWEKDLLITKLTTMKVHPEDIDYLVCSHSHPDHIGNNNLFTRAKVHIVGTSVYKKDNYDLSHFEPDGNYVYQTSRGQEVDVITYKPYRIDNNILIEPTPGHTLECISLFIENCERLGSVALSGDLFEKESDIDDESVWISAGTQNLNLQRANRARVFNKVDYILPGHGPKFKTDRIKPFVF